jgi:hypothetical protein
MAQTEKTEKDLGPLMKVKFVNIESPGVDIRFNYEGENYGPLIDGEPCELPRAVVDHLNGLSTPRMEYRIDPATGQARSTKTGRMHRFSFVPVG